MVVVNKERAIDIALIIFETNKQVSLCRLSKDNELLGLEIDKGFVRPPANNETMFTGNNWKDVLDFIQESESLGYFNG